MLTLSIRTTLQFSSKNELWQSSFGFQLTNTVNKTTILAVRLQKEINEGNPGPCRPDGMKGPRHQEHSGGALWEGDEHAEGFELVSWAV